MMITEAPSLISEIATDTFCQAGLSVIKIESQAVIALEKRINEEFAKACQIIFDCGGRVVVTGMGKSGHIARKIAATLASTGTPALFVHAGEASHGDMGMITSKDVVLAISHSGKTDELITLLPFIKRLGVPLISMCGDRKAILAENADVNLDISVSEEACPLGLAPTSSTTVTLVMGDALAIALLKARGFTATDFALSHPGGTLGRQLLLRVQDIMRTGDAIPKVLSHATVSEALLEMSAKGLGMTAVVDNDNKILGIYTDGDVRRTLNHNVNIHETPVSQVMTARCKVAKSDTLAAEILNRMETFKINALLVVDNEQRLIGALNMHDLLKARVV